MRRKYCAKLTRAHTHTQHHNTVVGEIGGKLLFIIFYYSFSLICRSAASASAESLSLCLALGGRTLWCVCVRSHLASLNTKHARTPNPNKHPYMVLYVCRSLQLLSLQWMVWPASLVIKTKAVTAARPNNIRAPSVGKIANRIKQSTEI